MEGQRWGWSDKRKHYCGVVNDLVGFKVRQMMTYIRTYVVVRLAI
jgi:hypothetical protein